MQLLNTQVGRISVPHSFLSLNDLDGPRAPIVYEKSAQALQIVNIPREASTFEPPVRKNTGPHKRFLVFTWPSGCKEHSECKEFVKKLARALYTSGPMPRNSLRVHSAMRFDTFPPCAHNCLYVTPAEG